MRTSKLVYSIMAVALTVALSACSNGKDGAPGAPGSGGKITATMNCSGVISGVTGPAAGVLNGLEVKYNAVLTNAGDVYSTASINDDYVQYSGTSFYAAGQGGSTTGEVVVIADFHGTGDAATWSVSLNRSTLVTTVVYDDLSLSAPVSLNFTASACSQSYF